MANSSKSSPKPFRARKAHKKSRNGCSHCKRRRIKCDELAPRCSRCDKLDLVCEYPQTPVASEDDLWDLSLLDPALRSPGASYSPRSPSFTSSDPPSADASELAIFEHYLAHTSRDPTLDPEDSYTLQVGIPNLAFRSRPLLNSVLALSAVCQARDAMPHDRGTVHALLRRADRYHGESLREIQDDIRGLPLYDHVLANAIVMGMYGAASHCVRIDLAREEPVAADLWSSPSRWIHLFRAARLAYVGLRDAPDPQEDVTYDVEPWHIERVPPPNEHVLFPIMASTVASGMETLRARALTVEDVPGSGIDLGVCIESLGVLESVVANFFWPETVPVPPPAPESGRLAEVSPWLRRYIASATAATPSRLPRRTIVAFVHRAPVEYLSFIQGVLDKLPVPGLEVSPLTELTPTQALALDIFAHWLVLMMLLEHVWWIGSIGAWELQRVVAFCQARGPAAAYGETWWPASMLEISRQLQKHAYP